MIIISSSSHVAELQSHVEGVALNFFGTLIESLNPMTGLRRVYRSLCFSWPTTVAPGHALASGVRTRESDFPIQTLRPGFFRD